MVQLERYLRPHWWYIFLTMAIKLLATGMELFIPDLMEVILDEKVPAGELSQIYIYGGLMLLCAAACLGGNILANRMSAVSSGRITRAIRHDLFWRLETLSARQMDRLTVPSAESRLTSDTYNINQLLARFQRIGVRAPILLVGGVIMTMRMDAPLALVLLSLLPIIAVVVYFVTKTSVPLYTRQQSVLDSVVRVVQENITGIRVIKALSKTEYRLPDLESGPGPGGGGRRLSCQQRRLPFRGRGGLFAVLHHDPQRYAGHHPDLCHVVQGGGQRQAGGPGPGRAGGSDRPSPGGAGRDACPH